MKGLRIGLLSTYLVVMMASSPSQAHHSFPATYLVEEHQEIQGQVVQFLFRNPHSFIHVMAPDKEGKMQRWAIEWGGGGALGRDSVTRETLKPGDKVIVSGNPGRNAADHRIRLQSIQRPSDGWKWSGSFE
jgi:DNA replication initiation complex subunit (GINS family)